MAQHLVELCTILVEESFGDAAALIWAHLAEHGRTQFAGLVSLARSSSIELSRTLPILISNRAIVYHIDSDYNATWYSVDIEGTYNLLRLSKLGDLVKQRCGKDAAHVITNMAQLGHVTVGDLTRIYGVQDGARSTEMQVNGARVASEPLDNAPIQTIEQLHAALLQLIKAGFLIKTSGRLFHTDFDVLQKLEKTVQEEHFPDGRVTGPKASALFVQAVNSQKRKQRDDDVVPGITDNHQSKRQRVSGDRQLDDELVLSINMKKYVIALRSRSYVRLAARHLGSSSATIYDLLLRTLERQLNEVTDGQTQNDGQTEDDDDDEACFATSTAAKIYDIIDPSTDFTSSIKVAGKDLPSSHANGKSNGYIQVQEDFSGIGIKQEQDSDDDGQAELSSYQNRAKLLELIERHLQSLEEHTRRFCHRQGQGKPAVWTVNFRSLTESIILAELDASITARFGKPAVRLLRLLRDKGRLEEKQIAANAFMQMKDVRQILSELYGAGYVEAQELAKDQTRQPARALYLWYFDAAKVQRMLIHQCYQSMARAYQRLAAERVRFKEALRKMRAWNSARFFGDNYYSAKTALESQLEGVVITATDGHDEEGNDATAGSELEADTSDDKGHTHLNGDERNQQTNQKSAAPPTRYVLGQTGLWRMDALHNFEKDRIKEWRAIESNYLGQIMRLDDLVVLLRDFDGRHPITSA